MAMIAEISESVDDGRDNRQHHSICDALSDSNLFELRVLPTPMKKI
jgi:hypothetical protein